MIVLARDNRSFMSRLLTIPQAADATPLGPAQRKFNQLQKQLDAARKKLLAWDEAVPKFAEAYARQVAPLRTEARQLRRAVAEQLDAYLAEPRDWTQGEREAMREIACALAREALVSHELGEAERQRWKALHDRHAPQSLDAEKKAKLQRMKQVLAAQTGLDLEHEQFDDAADLLRHVRRQMEQQREDDEADAAARAARRKPTSAQARREAEREEAQAKTQQTLREVFRKLASALHPDRAVDAEDAARRTALMQQVNAAYAAESLLGLLALQLELEQIDALHLRQASDAQIKHFNGVLQEQLDELHEELESRSDQFLEQFELDPDLDPNPARLGPLLGKAEASWRGEVYLANRDLESLSDRARAKRWIKKLRTDAQSGW